MQIIIFPNCIIAILGSGTVVLVKDGKEYKVEEATLSEILDLDDGVFHKTSHKTDEQGKCFICDIVLRSWKDSTPDSSDYNLEYDFEDMRELK